MSHRPQAAAHILPGLSASTRWGCLALLVLAACGGGKDAVDAGVDVTADTGETSSGGDGTDSADGSHADTDAATAADSAGASSCPPAAAFVAGTPAYTEITDDFGLLGVHGNRMGALDVDGDGRTDVLIRDGGGVNVFAASGARDTFLLRATAEGFEDVTQASRLLQRRVGDVEGEGVGGSPVVAGDIDNDGDVDVWIGRAHDGKPTSGETSELLLNDGKGQFSLGPATSAARFVGQQSVPTSASFVDFDRDGFLDLWVVHNMAGGASSPLQDRLLKGDGKGGFVDVTIARGLGTQPWQSVPALNNAKGHSWAWAATACDLNNDGLDELLAASYGRAPNHLWRAERDDKNQVRFVNESVASGYAYDERVDWTDNISARCYCGDNPTATGCKGVPSAEPALCNSLKAAFGPQMRWNHSGDREPWRLGGNSGTTVCFDVNNDGWLDLLTTEIVHWDVGSSSDPSELLFNLGAPEVRFQRVGNDVTGLLRVDASAGWDHGDITASIYDFDNDGWPDVHLAASDYPANRALLFRQAEPMLFQEVAPTDFFLRWRAAGVLALDVDDDGDLDVVTGHTRMRCEGSLGADCQPDNQVHLHRNLLSGRWLQLDLVGGAGSNRDAIGARVVVTALVDGKPSSGNQVQVVDGGHGQSGAQRPHLLHFGLGAACEAKVEIHWPDAAATAQSFNVSAVGRYRVVQGQAPTPVASSKR